MKTCLIKVKNVSNKVLLFAIGCSFSIVAEQSQKNTDLQLEHVDTITIASEVLKSKESAFDQNTPIITDFEWQELQLSNLVKTCGKPQTAFGHQGLAWLLMPLMDTQKITHRQTVVRTLIDDVPLYDSLQQALQGIKAGQEGLLSYWTTNKENRDRLESCYFASVPVAEVNKYLNTKSLALNGGVALAVAASIMKLFAEASAAGLVNELYDQDAVPKKGNRVPIGKKTKEFALTIIKGVFMGPLRLIQRDYYVLSKSNPGIDCGTILDRNGDLHFGLFSKRIGAGSAGDRYKALIDYGCFVSNLINTKNCKEGCEKDDEKLHLSFCDMLKTFASNSINCIPKPFFEGCVFGLIAGTSTALLYKWAESWHYEYKHASDMWISIREVRAHLINVARALRALNNLDVIVSSSSILSHMEAGLHLRQIMNKENWSEKLCQLDELINSSAFDESSKVYLPGPVLCAHRLMQEVKDELIPALQAVAEFDAYVALARMYKEHQDTDNKFVFVEFVDQDAPCINIDNSWEPLGRTQDSVLNAQDAVANPVHLGVHGKPVRLMLTGPNGGGKSHYFKAIGHAVVMGQGWGIAPAQHARMTVFGGLHTSLDPKQDISQGLSKFMAQKERIGRVYELMQHATAKHKVLVMLDEPFDGTTEYQMAERVYEFGLNSKKLSHAVVCIATHVKKPIELAKDGGYANYHVGIEETSQGVFRRTFKLLAGPANWWFDDQARATRYTDWLGTEMLYKARMHAVVT